MIRKMQPNCRDLQHSLCLGQEHLNQSGDCSSVDGQQEVSRMIRKMRPNCRDLQHGPRLGQEHLNKSGDCSSLDVQQEVC